MTETTPANANYEPQPERVRVGRNSYGQFYIVDPRWDHSPAPVYIRADIHEAEMDRAVRREVRLQRRIVKLETST